MTKYYILFLLFSCTTLLSAQRPSLTLTKEGITKIKSGLKTAPLFEKELLQIQKEIDLAILKGIDVPIPKDMAGGYTHQQHKVNYNLMHKAGNLYQFTGNEKYASFVKEMLFAYAEMYPSLGLHPTMKSYATGKIFWQCLNDANWLVFTSQAYDCIYDFLSASEREKLEIDLFIPFANFLSEENPKFFNRIHNHSTWANAAVGLMALAMNNDTLLHKALYGLEDDGINPDEIDNDGGYIKKDGIRQTGFLAQLDYSFSPEGYFSEGPYYQRYAIFPFLVFSHALHNKRPDLKIFEYRNGILKKATNTLLQLTDPQGKFFAINDSQKGMTYKAFEIVMAVDLMYLIDNSQVQLLEWAAKQNKVAFNIAGFYVAQKLETMNLSEPVKESRVYGDGVNGDKGGISVLRIDDAELLFKFSTHGMGHGHFDRLSYSFYNDAGEVLQDYGAVRWVNVDQKAGGRYLPENKTFGKQTIAHNTATINMGSQYKAKVKNAEVVDPVMYYFDADQENIKVVSAIENNAYANVNQHRTMMLYKDAEFSQPLILDLFTIESKEGVNIDLPLWYTGHLMKTSFTCGKNLSSLSPLGEKDGYQHIWQEGTCSVNEDYFAFNWFGNNRFYTQHSASHAGDKVVMGRAGANDPNFNLRSDPVMIHRKLNTKEAIFFNVLEAHGTYSKTTEIPKDPYSSIENVKVIHSDKDYIICAFSNQDYTWEVLFARTDNNSNSIHEVSVGAKNYRWNGIYQITKLKK